MIRTLYAPVSRAFAATLLAQHSLGRYHTLPLTTVSDRNFGLLIAYLLPGFTALWGISYFSETVNGWLMGTTADGPTIGGFLYVTLASVAAGMTVSTVRWAVIDSLHHATGINRPNWDFAKLQHHFDTYDRLEQNHYRYYQWYGGMLISLMFVESCRVIALGLTALRFADVGILLLATIFFAGSRDAIRKYHFRVEQLIGNHHPSSSTDPRNVTPTFASQCPATICSEEPPAQSRACVRCQCSPGLCQVQSS